MFNSRQRKNVIKNLQSEIQIPPDNDINPDISDKQAFQVIVKQIAGKIDAEIEDNITIDLSFDSPLTKDQIAVVKCLSSKEWNDDNTDEKISKEHSSSAMANVESYPEHETSSHQAVTRPLCQACAEKDKQIKAYEEKTREHEKSIELNKLQGESQLNDGIHYTKIINIDIENTRKIVNKLIYRMKENDEIDEMSFKFLREEEKEYKDFERKRIKVKVHSHDRNASVSKYLSQNQPDVIDSYDTWHGAKEVRRNMAKITKGTRKNIGKTWHPELRDKSAGVKTHVYWAMKNCNGNAA
ncbi:unnamed protein product [Mytilus edulis]|uniref:Uncharacterized protein n=1 Tax=Mytilus edulis TaxID=6550 RepID=A0A8S3TDD8_MYTED|nr:unnamed protein product [Mytilus edulis]